MSAPKLEFFRSGCFENVETFKVASVGKETDPGLKNKIRLYKKYSSRQAA